jgi:hypothetical protein
MTAHSTVVHDPLTSLDPDRTGQEVRQPETADLRQRIEALLREIFEGHEEFLGCTTD